MKSAIILHGICDSEEYHSNKYPSSSNSHWIPWLQKQLLTNQIDCQTPDVMNSYKGNYEDWLRAVQPHKINEETIIVCHSAGCGFFLKYLSENKDIYFDKLIMVAPFNDPYYEYGDFLRCVLDSGLSSRANTMHVFYSLDEDVKGVKETVDVIMKTYPNSKLTEFNNHGHFCLSDMGTEEFPELLDVILQKKD
jgi:uncharacterized protein